MILSGRRGADPYKLKPKYSQQPKQKIYAPSAFSFAYAGAKEKAIKKKTPKQRFRALRSATRTPRAPVSATPTHMLRICVNPPTAQAFKKA
ncbi:MAG TPA: hypothetical protein DD628_08045 [Clostridiales bacterium]|nr:hypothetical protein [Candidatus Apopatosoma intestinale]